MLFSGCSSLNGVNPKFKEQVLDLQKKQFAAFEETK